MEYYAKTEMSRKAKDFYLNQFPDEIRRIKEVNLGYDPDMRSFFCPHGRLSSNMFFLVMGNRLSQRSLLRFFIFVNINEREIDENLMAFIECFGLTSLLTAEDKL